MTRDEMSKVENIVFAHMENQSKAARCVIEIRRALGMREDASRPGYAGSAGGAAYVAKKPPRI